MIINLFETDEVYHNQVGGKGYNLHKLHKAGLPVPCAIVIQPQRVDFDTLADHLEAIEWLRDNNHYAVRSSGVGKDSQDKSWAGIFEISLYD